MNVFGLGQSEAHLTDRDWKTQHRAWEQAKHPGRQPKHARLNNGTPWQETGWRELRERLWENEVWERAPSRLHPDYKRSGTNSKFS